MRSTRSSTVLTLIVAALIILASPVHAQTKGGRPELKIIKDDLYERGNFYFVKGVIYNPNTKPVKNVEIMYYIWKKWMGKDGHGTVIRDAGGLVQTTIKYIPPKQSVEFTASGGTNAPVMTVESGLLPDPLDAQITAEWDR